MAENESILSESPSALWVELKAAILYFELECLRRGGRSYRGERVSPKGSHTLLETTSFWTPKTPEERRAGRDENAKLGLPSDFKVPRQDWRFGGEIAIPADPPSEFDAFLIETLVMQTSGELFREESICVGSAERTQEVSDLLINFRDQLFTEDRFVHVPSIAGCARCGSRHQGIKMTALRRPALDEGGGTLFTHWAPCPTTGEPILCAVLQDSTPDGD